MVSVRNVEAQLQKLIRRLKLTECTIGGRVRVCDVSTCERNIGVHVGTTAHPRGRYDRDELRGRAGDWLLADGYGGTSIYCSGERCKGFP